MVILDIKKTVCLLTILFSSSALAIDPQSIDVIDGVNFTPTLYVSRHHDDNVFNSPQQKKSSLVTTISPRFKLSAQDRLNVYALDYRLSHQDYGLNSESSDTSHQLAARAHIEFNDRNKLDLNASYQKARARRDATNNLYGESGNRYYNRSVASDYTLRGATGKIQVGAGYNQLRYNNNLRVGSRNKRRELDTADFSFTVYYPFLAKTDVLADFRHYDYDYTYSASRLDGDSRLYSLGLTWDTTHKTTGRVTVGRERRSFDDSSQRDTSSSTWDVSLTWRPVERSTFTALSERRIAGGSGDEQYIKTTKSTLRWNHDWGKQFKYISSSVDYSLTSNQYSGSNNNGRRDDVDSYGVKLTYLFKRWLDISLDYRYDNTDSNYRIADYNRRVIGLSIGAGL